MKLEEVIQYVRDEIKTLGKMCDLSEERVLSGKINLSGSNYIDEVISFRECLHRKLALEQVLRLLEEVEK